MLACVVKVAIRQTTKHCYVKSVSVLQSVERSAIQGNTGPEDPAGASSGSEVAAPEPQDFEVRGSRFSKSADERQRMLMQRKEELLLRARR